MTSAWPVQDARFSRWSVMHAWLRFDHARASARAADCVVAAIRPCTQVPGNDGFLAVRPAWSAIRERAASGHQHQRGLRMRTGHERRHPVARVAAGHRWTAVPPSARAGSCRQRIIVPPDWPLLPWSGLLIAAKRSPRSETPYPSALTDIRLARNGCAVSWLPGPARLGSISR